MLNVIADLRARLEGACGVPAYVNVPESRPETFVVVQREGGHRENRLLDRAGVRIYCYAPTEQKTWELSDAVADAMQDLAFSDGYASVEQTIMYSDPDPDARCPRWYLGYTIVNYRPTKE